MAVPSQTLSLTATAHAESGVQVVAASGELDLRTAPGLCLAVRRAAARDRPARIVIDLREIDFTDSTGLRALICTAHEVRALSGEAAVVATPGSQVDRLLTLAGAREFVAVSHTPQDAVALVGGHP